MNKSPTQIKPKIQLLATGGTIASRFAVDTQDVRVQFSGNDLAAVAAARLPGIDVATEDVLNIPSFEMNLELAFELVTRIKTCLKKPEVSGVVVTHGTDTLEETAFLADLLLDSYKPVVFTGSQLAADAPEPDGPRNLVNAILVAACERARGYGTLVVFDNEIHLAHDVAKTHTSRLTAFESPAFGKAGEIDGSRVLFHQRPVTRHVFKNGRIESRVDLIKLGIGADNRFIDCAVATGARGIVVEAFGRGNATPKVLEAVQRAVGSDVTVLVTSRCGGGRVEPMYGASGGASLARAGALFGGSLTGVKARILLAVLLGQHPSRDGVEQRLRCLAL